MLVYLATNKINGMQYVGQTKMSLEKRIKAHRTHARQKSHHGLFHEALREYGDGNFDWQIVQVCESKGDLDRIEEEAIVMYNTMAPNGYNTKDGALSGKHSEESKKKMSEARKKYWENKK
jgi:group I intron endonuclease